MISLFRFIFMSFWSALMISCAFVVMLLTLNRKLALVMARTMFSPGILWAAGIKIKVEGKENIDAYTPYIFVSNHMSHLDIPCLFYAIPSNLHFIAKKELKWVPFLGWFIAATGMIFVDRGNRAKAIASMNRAGELIKKGKSVIVFPEGTRSRSGTTKSFKKGSFMMAIQSEIPVVPVSIINTDVVFPVGAFNIKPHEVIVKIGAPIKPVENKEQVQQFINEVREVIIKQKGAD